MPMTITVNRSAKVTKDYNSQGYGLSLEAELPAELIHNPDGVAEAANHLFQLAEDLLAEQVNGGSRAPRAASSPRTCRAYGRNGGNGNGHSGATVHNGSNGPYRGRGNGNGRNAASQQPRPITQAQSKAVHTMCERLGYDAQKVAHEEFGTALSGLSIKQGSELIDILKKEITAQPATSNA